MQPIKVCADPFPPYQYQKEDGSFAGSDYEFVMTRLTKAGYAPKMKIAPWDQIYREFTAHKCQVLFQVQATPERLEKYYLSYKLRDAVTKVVTLNKQLVKITDYQDLKNYRLGIIRGFANGFEIDSLPENCKLNFLDTEDLLNGLYNGQIDCGVCDAGVLEYLQKSNQNLYEITKLTYKRPLYVMFWDKEMCDRFNNTVE
jgi:ABC-type amino acid transport substrate-binding protein